MDDTLELLDILLDGVTGQRLKLISEDEARALIVLLGFLDDVRQDADVRGAAAEMRSRLGSRLGRPAGLSDASPFEVVPDL
ncbi:hypothetical protein ACFXEL_33250 [Streptomyces sp. NPDC059382]|uniref:hypothetical protein n=1 Tax=Streptomyces sp. NPDC059382 TaxID=3346816 RepID=UPI003676F46D